MEHEITAQNVVDLAQGKITLGKNLIQILNNHSKVDGVAKLQRKINQEIKFLEKVCRTNSLKINHVMCSNLTHYEFLIKVLCVENNVTHVDYGFPVDGRSHPLRVDIVSEGGSKWVKAIARNPKSINDAAKGCSGYGSRSILDQAEEFLFAASKHPYMFQNPKVFFYFSHIIDNELLEELQSIGIEIVRTDENGEFVISSESKNEIETLNLDVSTMIAYVSSLTNGSSNWTFEEQILTDQAKRERESPVKAVLDSLFKGKKLICCETALNSFKEIISLLAGPSEQNRAEDLLKRVGEFPDILSVPQELECLNLSGKIKPRSLKIFAFGIKEKALTVTSNEGFIRSAKMQGLDIPVFIHQARALTEHKEKTAHPLEL